MGHPKSMRVRFAAGDTHDGSSGTWTNVAMAAWLAAVSAGLAGLWLYETRPGAAAPSSWPGLDGVSGETPHLLLFAHPRCPCTRATIEQLDRVLTAAGRRDASVHVYLYRPEGAPESFSDTDLRAHALRIPGVSVHDDLGGRAASKFGAETSGFAVYYDEAGRLRFQGGLTISRGHSGDNAATDALTALLRGDAPPRFEAPVFGCAIFDCETER